MAQSQQGSILVVEDNADVRFMLTTNLGVTPFLSKPVDLATFIKTVAHLFPEKAAL